MREVNFDGLVGPTHNFGGLSPGNIASTIHGGQVSNPRAAALQGLAKMRFVRGLGVAQAVLPPHPRPRISVLRRLGFRGSDEEIITTAARTDDLLLRLVSSAAAMWTANAATVVPSRDAADGRAHLVPANLGQMFHRAIEADTTRDVLRAIFADAERFAVHEPLPAGAHFADEGAANHTRLVTPDHAAVHVFAWGRRAFGDAVTPGRFPARHTLEASQALARLGEVEPARALFPQQHPDGIDAGSFHTDVLAVGNGSVLLLHELAFVDPDGLVRRLRALLGDGLRVVLASEGELPARDAVAAYPFNSQLLSLPDGSMTIVAPTDSRETPRARAFLERVVAEDNSVRAIHYVDLRQSMNNGGGPACLRLRVALEDAEIAALGGRVLFTDELERELSAWMARCYRDRLAPADLADPALARESMAALDELTRILGIGSVYDFQRAGSGRG
jgi:succinylarginine dihydrolase